jgi:uncharacterized protein (TIGR03435 family)
MKGRLPGAGLLVCAPWMALGQSAAPGPSFEVASVKPAVPPADGGMRRISSSDAGQVTYHNVTLRSLLISAYQVKDYQISGPDWLGSERYDVAAKLPGNAPPKQVPPMLQTLLAERFHLTLHHQQKELPAYALVVAKSGYRLKPLEEAPSGISFSFGPSGRTMQGKLTLTGLANALAAFIGSPVLDATGIEGTFDIHLAWSPDDREQGVAGKWVAVGRGETVADSPKAPDPPEAPSGPSLFMAVQGLGLRLEARKAPLDTLVIDHAEKIPAGN